MSTIKPTVGRQVWYWPDSSAETDRFMKHRAEQPLAATVSYVWSDRMVNLLIVDHDGAIWSRTNVTLLQSGDDVVSLVGYAQWPQREQGGNEFKIKLPDAEFVQAINQLSWTAKEMLTLLNDDAKRVGVKILTRIEQLLDAGQPSEPRCSGSVSRVPHADETPKHPSHPDVPRPSDAELVELARGLCHAIEACGASPELTHAVTLASDLHWYLQKPRSIGIVGLAIGQTQEAR